MTGYDPDAEIVQKALERFVPTAVAALSSEPLPPHRADALAALGRLDEARDTAQSDVVSLRRELVTIFGGVERRADTTWNDVMLKRIADTLAAAEAERDVAIQERDEARRNLQAVEQQRQWRANERDRAEARLERVEAAAEGMLSCWGPAKNLDALWPGLAERVAALRAALSDVTPPPSGAAGAVDE
jgi:hypothetical protein